MNTKLYAILTAIIVVTAGSIAIVMLMQIAGEPDDGIEILAIERDELALNYTMSQIMAMPSETGTGTRIRDSGTVVGPFEYTGVSLEYLLTQTGDLPVDYTVEVTADDGYTTYFTKSQIEGTFFAYDESGDPIGFQEFTLILAYAEGGNPLPTGGPLRVVTLCDQDYLTDAHFWAKDVVKITLIDAIEPWELILKGVKEWNMSHDTYYSLASCPYHRVEMTIEGTVYAGVPLWTIVSSMDGGEDGFHYKFNIPLAVAGYNVSLFNDHGEYLNFTSVQLAGNSSILIAGWADGLLLDGDDWPLKLITPEGIALGGIIRMEMWIYD